MDLALTQSFVEQPQALDSERTSGRARVSTKQPSWHF
jgi:hypothetical protein